MPPSRKECLSNDSRRSCIIKVTNYPKGAEQPMVAHSSLSKYVYATVIAEFMAAYLMYRRGESLIAIARQTVTNPVGSLASEQTV